MNLYKPDGHNDEPNIDLCGNGNVHHMKFKSEDT